MLLGRWRSNTPHRQFDTRPLQHHALTTTVAQDRAHRQARLTTPGHDHVVTIDHDTLSTGQEQRSPVSRHTHVTRKCIPRPGSPDRGVLFAWRRLDIEITHPSAHAEWRMDPLMLDVGWIP